MKVIVFTICLFFYSLSLAQIGKENHVISVLNFKEFLILYADGEINKLSLIFEENGFKSFINENNIGFSRGDEEVLFTKTMTEKQLTFIIIHIHYDELFHQLNRVSLENFDNYQFLADSYEENTIAKVFENKSNKNTILYYGKEVINDYYVWGARLKIDL